MKGAESFWASFSEFEGALHPLSGTRQPAE